jgi:hypothetical protein
LLKLELKQEKLEFEKLKFVADEAGRAKELAKLKADREKSIRAPRRWMAAGSEQRSQRRCRMDRY